MDRLVANLLAAYRERIDDARLDEPGDQEGGAGQARDLRAEDRLSRQVARLLGARDRAATTSSATSSARASSSATRDLAKLGKPVDRDEVGHDAADGQRLLQPRRSNEIVFPAGDPAAAVLRSDGRRRGQLRRDRRGHRPRDQPRLRRPGQPVRRAPATCATGGPTDDRERFDAQTKALVAQYDGVRAGARAARQRRADARREHRRHRRPRDRATRPTSASLGGQARAGDRRLHRRPALLLRLRAGVARQGARRRAADADHVRSALAGGVPRQRRRAQPPGVLSTFGVKPGDKMYLPPEQRVSIW